jgi:hypothetical protein
MPSVEIGTDYCEICRRPASLRTDPFSPTRKAMLCAACFQLLAGQAKRPPICPFKFKEEFWPDVRFYKEQMDIIESVVETPQTIVVAGNKLGKDFVAGYIILWFFLTGGGRGFDIMTRVVTTSVNADHLDVLWGEIHRFIQSCKVELDSRRGGPLIVNQLELRKIMPTTRRECPKSYGDVLRGGRGVRRGRNRF